MGTGIQENEVFKGGHIDFSREGNEEGEKEVVYEREEGSGKSKATNGRGREGKKEATQDIEKTGKTTAGTGATRENRAEKTERPRAQEEG